MRQRRHKNNRVFELTFQLRETSSAGKVRFRKAQTVTAQGDNLTGVLTGFLFGRNKADIRFLDLVETAVHDRPEPAFNPAIHH